MDRRKFIKNSSLLAFGSTIGLEVVFGKYLPEGYVPLGMQDPDPFKLFNKSSSMVVLNDKPWNIEAQAHLLNDPVTPNRFMFIRNNGLVPRDIEEGSWTLTIDGESVSKPRTYTLADLKTRFTKHRYQLTLECGGNGRSEFNPPAKGNQWTVGAVSCAQWGGLRLRDLLEDVGIGNNAVYVAYHAVDKHLSLNPDKEPISRGVPIAKAMQEETLLAYEMNGEPIPLVHGFPLRLVAGGFPASASGKWVNRISVRNKVHDGPKMTGDAYRVPCNPVAPGELVDDKDMCIIESMPVKSLITSPKTGAVLKNTNELTIEGHAWAGELEVARMEYSIDFGASWQECILSPPPNRLAWQRFKAPVVFPKKGYYEVWARATDTRGISQPVLVPGWNPKGYLNNACHRIAVKVT